MSLQQEDFADYKKPVWKRGFSVGRFEISGDGIWGGLAILPVLALYIIIAIIPISFAIYASFHNWPATMPSGTWVGLENYNDVLFGEFLAEDFWASFYRGVVFMVGSTVLQTAVGIWMALVVNNISRGQKFLSTLIFTAYLIPTIVVSLLARFMVNQQVGVFHAWGAEALNLWSGNLLTGSNFAMAAVILVGSWKFAVFVTLFTLAQLRGIPTRFYEAAKICGATTWEMFRDITFQRIKGVLLVAVLLRGIFMFNKFDIIEQLTGGANGTRTLPIYAFELLRESSSFGLSSAVSVIMFLFLLAGTLIYFTVFNPSEEAET